MSFDLECCVLTNDKAAIGINFKLGDLFGPHVRLGVAFLACLRRGRAPKHTQSNIRDWAYPLMVTHGAC